MRARRVTDLELVAVLAVLCAVVTAAVPAHLWVIRLLPALALVLVLPGYAISAALLRPTAVRPAERVVLSIALSIGATILGTLLLYISARALESRSWAVWLAAATVIAAYLADARGHRRFVELPRVPRPGSHAWVLGAGVLLIGSAFVLGRWPLHAPRDTTGTTALWMVARERGAAELGVRSNELHRARYGVEVLAGGRRLRTFGPIELAPGQTWRTRVDPGPGRAALQLTARLHPAGNAARTTRTVTLRAGRDPVAAR